jgi:hypothetical protein
VGGREGGGVDGLYSRGGRLRLGQVKRVEGRRHKITTNAAAAAAAAPPSERRVGDAATSLSEGTYPLRPVKLHGGNGAAARQGCCSAWVPQVQFVVKGVSISDS